MACTYRMLLAATAMVASGAAFGQSSMPSTPGNAAGSPMAASSMAAHPTPSASLPSSTESAVTAFDKLRSGSENYVTRSEVARLPGSADFEEADRNHDGRLNQGEFERYWDDYEGAGR